MAGASGVIGPVVDGWVVKRSSGKTGLLLSKCYTCSEQLCDPRHELCLSCAFVLTLVVGHPVGSWDPVPVVSVFWWYITHI